VHAHLFVSKKVSNVGTAVDGALCLLGSRCILSAYLNLDGTVVNDSHAEIIARRAFVKYVVSLLVSLLAVEE